MAKRITQEAWTFAEDLFMAGKSLNAIALETGISKSSISEKAKKEGWIKGKHEPLKQDAVILAEKTEHLTEQQVRILNNDVDETVRHRKRTFDISEKAQVLLNNKMVSEKEAMSTYDLKTVIEANDKASITLGVNQRFASTTINNTNAQQTNELAAPVIMTRVITNKENVS